MMGRPVNYERAQWEWNPTCMSRSIQVQNGWKR